MRRRTFLKTTAGSGAMFSVAGCSGDSDDNDSPPDSTATPADDGGSTGTPSSDQSVNFPDPYKIGSPSPAQPVYNFAIQPLLQNRLKEEQGVDTELKTHKGFTPMVASLVKGETDIGYLTLPTYLNARKQGFPLVSPLGFLKEYDFIMIGSSDMDSVQDLKGKTIALHSPQSMSTVTGKTIIREEFGNVDAVNYKFIIGTPNRLAALKSGNVDGAVVFLSGALQGQKDGYAKILAQPWNYDVLQSQTAAVWVTLEDTLKQYPERMQKLVDYLLNAYERSQNADPQQVTDDAIATGIYPEFDPDVWLQAFKRARDVKLWPPDGGLKKQPFNEAMDLLVDAGLIEKEDRIAPEELYTTEFL